MKNVIRAFGLLCLLGFLGGCAPANTGIDTNSAGQSSSYGIGQLGTNMSNNQQQNDRSNLPDAPQP